MNYTLVYGMTNNPGGIETYLLNLFLRIDKSKYMLDFVSDFPSITYSDVLKKSGSRLYYIDAKSKSLFKQWKQLWIILKHHPEYKTMYFNILDAGALLTMIIPFVIGRKIVIHSHNSSTEKIMLHRICRPFLAIVSKDYAACSSEAAKYMFGKNYKKALIIPNVIDAKKFTYNPDLRKCKRKELGIENEFVICNIGRITEQKNPLGLIDIFEAFYKKHPNSILISVGSGDMMGTFKDYIESKSLTNAVLILGKRSDVAEILQASDLFLFPSLFEGFGIVIIEAQASGLPCMISDCIPKEVIITNLVSMLSIKDSSNQWCNEIERMMSIKRKNTYIEVCKGGYDQSCASEYDVKLFSVLFQ